jgi:TLC domain
MLFYKYLPENKFPLDSKLRSNKSEMLGERVFKLIANVFCVVSLYVILGRDDCDFFDVRLGGPVSRPIYFKNYPCQKVPSYLDGFYLFKLSYHLYELGYTIVMHRGRADFPEYVLHHLMTWSLIFFSYSLNMLPIGSAVMILHDLTDLSVTLFKLTVDITPIFV